MDELLELFATPAVGQKRPRDDDDDNNDDDDDALNREARRSAQPAVDETMNSTTWAVRLRDFFQHRLPGQQARRIVVDSACSGMCSHSMALQDRNRDIKITATVSNQKMQNHVPLLFGSEKRWKVFVNDVSFNFCVMNSLRETLQRKSTSWSSSSA
eukprot:2874014-Amphidinium_carterae.2